MALVSECRQLCANNVLDTADIVREMAIFHQLTAPPARTPRGVQPLFSVFKAYNPVSKPTCLGAQVRRY